jgi:CTP:molybdopterin cytidylyltransferase MocA
MRRMRRNDDKFIYEAVHVGSFEDAALAIMVNNDIQAVVLADGFTTASNLDLPDLKEFISRHAESEPDETKAGSLSLTLARRIKQYRPEIDLYLLSDRSPELLAGADPIAPRAARSLLQGVGEVLAVVPPGRAELSRALEAAGCRVLETVRTALGMGSSLAAAVEASAHAGGWIAALGDMPSIEAKTIARVKGALEAGALIAAPFDSGDRRGHPVGFAAALRAELMALRGDVGAREVLARHAESIVRIVTTDPGIFVDIDTEEDLRRLEAGPT